MKKKIAKIPLKGSQHFTTIAAEDAPWASKHDWFLSADGEVVRLIKDSSGEFWLSRLADEVFARHHRVTVAMKYLGTVPIDIAWEDESEAAASRQEQEAALENYLSFLDEAFQSRSAEMSPQEAAKLAVAELALAMIESNIREIGDRVEEDETF
ncbi:MAG TPA: hypothetical protein PKN93_18840, partial [Leptospiraceae bacterium]|nr:hypothetical protein [Leptospiraceae bacterium]